VDIFILPGPDVIYILSPLVCPGCTQISFTRFDAEKDLPYVAFAEGKKIASKLSDTGKYNTLTLRN